MWMACGWPRGSSIARRRTQAGSCGRRVSAASRRSTPASVPTRASGGATLAALGSAVPTFGCGAHVCGRPQLQAAAPVHVPHCSPIAPLLVAPSRVASGLVVALSTRRMLTLSCTRHAHTMCPHTLTPHTVAFSSFAVALLRRHRAARLSRQSLCSGVTHRLFWGDPSTLQGLAL